MSDQIEAFFDKESKWKALYNELREIVLECGLEESFKWKHPCYTYKNNNVVLMHGFKEYCALLFHKGALLKDTENILIQQTENVQAARQIRFSDLQEIEVLRPIIKAYIFEAIEVEKAGLKVEFKKTKEFDMPEEFQKELDKDTDLKKAFESLTPGRQRGYLLHFSSAKQPKTRKSRIEKCKVKIFNGKGLNDR